MRAILFEVDNTPLEIEYTGELSQLQAAVDGYIQPIEFRLEDNYFTAWVNEEGLLRGLPENEFITDLIGYAFQDRNFRVVGNVLIVGQGVDGDTRGLTDDEVHTLQSMWNARALAMNLITLVEDAVKDVPPPPPMHTLN